MNADEWHHSAHGLMDIARQKFNTEGTLQGLAVWLAERGPDGNTYDPPVVIFFDRIEEIVEAHGDEGLERFLETIFRRDAVLAYVMVYRAAVVPPGMDPDDARARPDRERQIVCTIDHADQEGPILYTAEVFQGAGRACIAGFEYDGPVTEGRVLELLPR